jgi:hypothetical protein
MAALEFLKKPALAETKRVSGKEVKWRSALKFHPIVRMKFFANLNCSSRTNQVPDSPGNLHGFSASPTLEQPLQALQRGGDVAGQRLDLRARPGQADAVNFAGLGPAALIHLEGHSGDPVAEPDQGALAPDVSQGGIG